MSTIQQNMTPAQLASLVDAALRTSDPLPFFDATVGTFKLIGRHEDAIAVAWIGCLYVEGELEAVMSLRAAWRRGEDRSAAKVGKELLNLRA